ncbi:MAG: kelch repeat-containing protein [Caldilineaceae bacterium]
MFHRIISLFPTIGSSLGLLILLLLLDTPATFAQTDSTTGVNDSPSITEGWLVLNALEQGLADPGVEIVDNALHVVGGLSPEGPAAGLWQLNSQSRIWQRLPDLPVPRSDAATAVISDTLYVIGGYNMWYGGALHDTHGYESAMQTWITATALITPVSGAAAVVVNNEIYVFGGFDNVSETALVQRYNPKLNRWTLGTPMPWARSEFDAVVLDGLVYLIGGNIFPVGSDDIHVATNGAPISSAQVVVYDPTLNEWRTTPPLPEPRVDAAAIVRNGEIYVTGGTDRWIHGTIHADVFVYDPQQDQWHTGPSLPTARGGHRGALLDDHLYVVGGYDANGISMANVTMFDTIAATIYLPVISAR